MSIASDIVIYIGLLLAFILPVFINWIFDKCEEHEIIKNVEKKGNIKK